MLAWLKSPQGSAVTVAAVAAVLGLLEFAPRPAGTPGTAPTLPDSRPGTAEQAASMLPKASSPATTPRPALPAQQASLPPPPAASPAGVSPIIATPTAPDSAPAKAGGIVPSFDVVRVDKTGEAVVAGRAAPDTEVELVDGGTVVAHVKTDASGQFAMLPPALSEGEHYLSLQTARAGEAHVASAQSVAVSVAKSGVAKPMVALLSPDQPAKVLSDAAPVQPAGGGATPSAAADRPLVVAIQSVEAGAGGQLTASGLAEAGHQCRLYLNGAFLADVTAGQDGRWSVKVSKGMKPGKYTVRADELAKLDGAVTHRAEVPFTYPVTASMGSGRRLLLAKAATGPAPKAAQVSTAPRATSAATAATTTVAGAPLKSGSSASQAEPVREASAAASSTDATASANDPSAVRRGSSVVVNQLQTAMVTRGDSLWRISRKMLGHGINYTEIYASNTAQIRDPKLIYPGQVFVVPNRAVN